MERCVFYRVTEGINYHTGAILQVSGKYIERHFESGLEHLSAYALDWPDGEGLWIFEGECTNQLAVDGDGSDMEYEGDEPDFDGTFRRLTQAELENIAIGTNIFE